MPDDPNAKRAGPAPKHPSGYPALDDAPVHVAPAVDVRGSQSGIPAAPSTSFPPMAAEAEELDDQGNARVPFALAFPVEERVSAFPPAHEDRGPMTVDYERGRGRIERYDDGPETKPLEVPPHWRATSEPPSADLDRDALLRDLAAMGGLDETPDRLAHREVGGRASLGRARALRFRLMLHDVWPPSAWPVVEPAKGLRPLHIDLALDAALLAGVSDGAPSRAIRGPAAYGLPFLRVIVDFLRGQRPDLPRSALRDRGSASISRLTIVGWKTALEQLAKSARALPDGPRFTALVLAAGVAQAPAMNEHRFGALSDLERALGLPTGSVATALDEARS